MASIQGFMDGSFDFKHMYNIADAPGRLPQPTIIPNTIYSFLVQSKRPCFQQFAALLRWVQMDGMYNDTQACCTMFIFEQDLGDFKSYDSWNLSKMVMYHTCPTALPYEFLKGSKAMFIDTKLKTFRILVENINPEGTLLNRSSFIKEKIVINGSVIYVIPNVLNPVMPAF